MRVVESVIKSEGEPRISVQREQVLAMMLQPGAYQSGLRRSELTRHESYAGQLILCRRGVEVWIRRGELHVLNIVVSDAALAGANDGKNGEVEVRHSENVVDSRVAGLVGALNAERVAGFPSGQLFLDSLEQALALALVDGYAFCRPSLRSYRGGLSPAHLRKVTELVHAKMEEGLTLRDMAQSVELSISHFSQMFRRSTGETPHQFVLHQRVERAKEMLRAAEARVLDVAIACGFKTQQHFARVFRRLSGLSPTQYRHEHDESGRSDPGGRSLDTTCVL
jgi:AraC family transcriptional regulator